MKKFFKKSLRALLKMLILILAALLVCFIITKAKNLNFNTTFMYIGIVFMVVGLFNGLGLSTSSFNFKDRLVEKSLPKSQRYQYNESFKSKTASLSYMAFVSITGFIIIMLSYFI